MVCKILNIKHLKMPRHKREETYMIKLIVGNKGSGKTKALINMVNSAATTSKGNVVCIEKGLKLTYDIDHKARLIDSEHYSIKGFENLYGFITGILAGNYDITDLFVDSTLKIGGNDLTKFAEVATKLEPLAEENNVVVTFTLSCAKEELPESVKKFCIEY